AGDAEVEIPVVDAGRRVQARVVRVSVVVDLLEEAANEHVAVDAQDGLHLAGGGVPERRVDRTGGGADLGQVLHGGPVHRRELATDVRRGAVAVDEADRVHGAVDA